MSSSDRVDLGVQVGALRLANSIIAASGTFGCGLEFAHLVDLKCLAGSLTKRTSLEPLEGVPGPPFCETPSAVLEADVLKTVEVASIIKGTLPLLQKYNTVVTVSRFACTLKDNAEFIRPLEDVCGVTAHRLIISFPNVRKGGSQSGYSPDLVAETVMAARELPSGADVN